MNVGRFFGMALEESFGELPETPDWVYCDFSSEDLGPPDGQYVMFEGATSRTPIYASPGNYVTEGTVAIPADIVSLGYALLGALGNVESEKLEDGYSEWIDTLDVDGEEAKFTIQLEEGETLTELIIESDTEGASYDEGAITVSLEDSDYTAGDIETLIDGLAEVEEVTVEGGQESHRDNWLGTMDDFEEVETDAIYKHTFSPADTLPTFTMAIGKELYQHNFGGLTFDTLNMEYENNFVVLGMGVIGGKDSKESDPADIGPCDLPESILTSVMSTFERDGTDITLDIEEFNLGIENNVEVDDAVPAASRYPAIAFLEQLNISVEMDISFADLDTLESYWGGEDGPTDEVEETNIQISFVQEEGKEEFTVTLPAAIAQNYSNPVEGRSRITQSITYEAITSKEECKAIEVELINSHESYEVSE